MARRGRYLEVLVEALENSNLDKNSNIISPAYLEDKVSKSMREIDVLITQGQGHHQIKMAFECKDWIKKVGCPEVEAFANKIEHLAIHKAIIVSASGFSKPAIKKANFYNISCLSMESVPQIDWVLFDSCVVKTTKPIRNEWFIDGDEPEIKNIKSMKVIHDDGYKLDETFMNENATKIISEFVDIDPLLIDKEYSYTFKLLFTGFKIIDLDTSNEYKATSIECTLTFKVIESSAPVKPFIYRDEVEDQIVSEGVTIPVQLSKDEHKNIVLLSKGNGQRKVILTQSE